MLRIVLLSLAIIFSFTSVSWANDYFAIVKRAVVSDRDTPISTIVGNTLYTAINNTGKEQADEIYGIKVTITSNNAGVITIEHILLDYDMNGQVNLIYNEHDGQYQQAIPQDQTNFETAIREIAQSIL